VLVPSRPAHCVGMRMRRLDLFAGAQGLVRVGLVVSDTN
jgi:hypothetical protein